MTASTLDVRSLFDVAGRRALVTGASRGIGLRLAESLAAAGCEVTIVARSPQPLERARVQVMAGTGARVHAVAFDATQSDQVAAGVTSAVEAMGGLDIVVNNAGVQFRAAVTEFPDDQWHRLLETNVSTAFFVSREAAKVMIPQAAGKIVNICSVQSELARPAIAPYSATKGALKMLTRGLCADLGPYGIQVNGLAPGYVDTELTAALVADDEFSAWIARRTPAGRWGQVDDLVGTLLFLSSRASDFVNGQIVYVDGGMTSVL
ncbi:SDR family oxidoreductase [Frankia sp. Cr1]|uniref:SDR family oxidoreductase n=1 Tax=Frankia sp. Cr1 TaxID=3073931 RepID=UPI002AD2B19E|nr:SDR family oxidoreductase [Frankia sp. Cr1]